MTTKKIGFIGLGIMGRPMAKNLLKAGYSLVVYDIIPSAVEDVVKAGAQGAGSAKEAAAKTEVVITMLPDSAEVRQAILGEGGVIEGIRSGSLVIDMSSINPLVSQEIARTLKTRGVEMLDAPVSGGEPMAIQGTLSIMVGGDKVRFNDCLPIFKHLGKNIVLAGSLGAGGFTKLCNQIIVALNIAAVGEALTLGVKAGLDPEVIFQAIRGGLAGSTVMEAKVPMIIGRNFKPGFKVKLHLKDLNNALSTAKDLGVPLPLTGLMQQILVSLVTEGKQENDHSAIATFFEKMSKVEIRSPKG
jgi:2-hydroxy-3-oxopropionate reductase